MQSAHCQSRRRMAAFNMMNDSTTPRAGARPVRGNTFGAAEPTGLGEAENQVLQRAEERPAVLMDEEGAVAQESVLNNSDLLKIIFSMLGMSDLGRVAMSCQLWRLISNSEEFWQHMDFSDCAVRPEQMLALARRHPNIRTLKMNSLQPNERFLTELMDPLIRLGELQLRNSTLTDEELKVLGSRLPALERLVMENCGLSGRPAELAVAHGTVRELRWEGCSGPRLSLRCPALERLSLRNSTLVSFMPLASATLREVDLRGCEKLSDVTLRAALTRLTGLRILRCSGVAALSNDTLREVAISCTELRELDASSCTGVTLNGVRNFAALRKLDVSACNSLSLTTAVPALETFGCLEVLALNKCSLLTHLPLSLPRLQSIALQSCRALASVDLRCPRLEEVTLGDPNSMGPGRGCRALKHVVLASNALTRLAWRAFPGLETVKLACPALTDLDLSECDKLGDGVFGSLGDDAGEVPDFSSLGPLGGCPSLRHLRLESCEGLANVRMSSTSLVTLSLASCKGLASLRLACPALRHLALEECDQLAAVELAPAGVRGLSLGTCPLLQQLALDAPHLSLLDLKGCGQLVRLRLACPRLASLDATFCSRLTADALAAALASAPPLRSLVLSVCTGLGGARGLPPFSTLQALTLLDLSYTEVEDIEPVLRSCPRLAALKLSSCRCLAPDALRSVLSTLPPAAPAAYAAVQPMDVSLPRRLVGLTAASCRQLDAAAAAVESAKAASGAASPRDPGSGAELPPAGSVRRDGARHGSSGSPAALPQLTELDVSYCPLPAAALADVLFLGARFESVAINDCSGATDAIWARLNLPPPGPSDPAAAPAPMDEPDAPAGAWPCQAAEPRDGIASADSCDDAETRLSVDGRARSVSPARHGPAAISDGGARSGGLETAGSDCDAEGLPLHALKSLSCVGCKALRRCWLGLVPEDDAAARSGQAPGRRWRPVPTLVRGLRSLRLGLSGVSEVALALPQLTSLDLNTCASLRALELRCPLLLTAFFQACRSLPVRDLEGALGGCGCLETLDAQHSAPLDPAALARLRTRCPSLRCLLHSHPLPPPPLLLALSPPLAPRAPAPLEAS